MMDATRLLRAILLAIAITSSIAPPVAAQQDLPSVSTDLQASQQQAAQTRADASAYRSNADGYRAMAKDAREQAARSAASSADARKQGDEERRSYWDRQQKFWEERISYDEEQARLNDAKAGELERQAAELEARIDRLKASQGDKNKPAAVPPGTAAAPTAPAPSAGGGPPVPAAAQQSRRRPAELAEFVGLWRDKTNNVEGVIEGINPADPTAGTDVVFKGHKLTWSGTFDAGGGDKPARLTFSYKPKWSEMNQEIPDWARRKVEGQLEWKMVLEQPDDEYACVLPTLEATWHAGEVSWDGDGDSGSARVTGEGQPQTFKLDKEDDELELQGYFQPSLLIHVGDPQRAMTDPVQFLVEGQRFHVEVHMSKEAARTHSPTAGVTGGARALDWAFERDFHGETADVTFRGLTSGRVHKLGLQMALQTRNHPVVRYETTGPVAITDQWGVENKINTTFDNGELVEVSFGAAKQEFRFFSSVTKLKLAARDEGFRRLATVLGSILAAPGITAQQRQQADNMLKLVRNARAFVHDVQVRYDASDRDLKFMNDRARYAIVDEYYRTIIFTKHTRWFGQGGLPPGPDNPFGIRWASEEELQAVFAVMKSAERERDRVNIILEGASAGAGASAALYSSIAYSGLAIAFHSTPVGEAYLAWYGEDIYGNRVDWTDRIGAALGFGTSVLSLGAGVVGALDAVRDVNRIFAVEHAGGVNAVVEASVAGVGGERRVISGVEHATPATAPGSAASRRRVLHTERNAGATTCAATADNIQDLIADALAAEERRAARAAGRPPPPARPSRDPLRPWHNDPSFVHRGAEILDAPEELHSFRQLGPECRHRSADVVEQIVRGHPVNPRANPMTAQTRRAGIKGPDGSPLVWKEAQDHGASTAQVGAYAATDLRARYYNADLLLSEIADFHETGFGVTLALEMEHVASRHQVALVAVEYGPIGRFLKRPKSFTIFDTNYPSKLFKYKSCDLDKLLLRKLNPGETRRIRGAGPRSYRQVSPGVTELETRLVTHEMGDLLERGGRSQKAVDIFHFR